MPGATGYNVKRSATTGSGYTVVGGNVTGTNYTDAGLVNNAAYYYVVSDLEGTNESANSTEVSATPATRCGSASGRTSPVSPRSCSSTSRCVACD